MGAGVGKAQGPALLPLHEPVSSSLPSQSNLNKTLSRSVNTIAWSLPSSHQAYSLQLMDFNFTWDFKFLKQAISSSLQKQIPQSLHCKNTPRNGQFCCLCTKDRLKKKPDYYWALSKMWHKPCVDFNPNQTVNLPSGSHITNTSLGPEKKSRVCFLIEDLFWSLLATLLPGNIYTANAGQIGFLIFLLCWVSGKSHLVLINLDCEFPIFRERFSTVLENKSGFKMLSIREKIKRC